MNVSDLLFVYIITSSAVSTHSSVVNPLISVQDGDDSEKSLVIQELASIIRDQQEKRAGLSVVEEEIPSYENVPDTKDVADEDSIQQQKEEDEHIFVHAKPEAYFAVPPSDKRYHHNTDDMGDNIEKDGNVNSDNQKSGRASHYWDLVREYVMKSPSENRNTNIESNDEKSTEGNINEKNEEPTSSEYKLFPNHVPDTPYWNPKTLAFETEKTDESVRREKLYDHVRLNPAFTPFGPVPMGMIPRKIHDKIDESKSRTVVGIIYGIIFVLLILSFSCIFLVYRSFQKKVKDAEDVDYPAYGITGPSKEAAPPTGDRHLAHSAQMYHYQHQKQQIKAMENKEEDCRQRRVSDSGSDEDDFTVYECPGLATTGEMEVKNPMFQDEEHPKAQEIEQNGTGCVTANGEKPEQKVLPATDKNSTTRSPKK